MANPEAQPAADAAEAPKKAKLPMLIGMVAVGLAVGGGTGAAVIGPMVAKKMGKTTPIVAAEGGDGHAAEGGDHAPAEGGDHGGGEAGKEGGAAESVPHVLDNLVLNPANSGGSRFLLLTVAIETAQAAALEQFKTRDAELRDIVLTTLSTKTVEQLTDITKRDEFKTEVIGAIDARFGKKTVKSLYFPQFVVQ